MDLVEILAASVVTAALIGACAAYLVAHQVLNGAPPLEKDLVDEVLGLKRQQRLLQGRLNSLAPPRLGTGEIVAPEAPQAVIPSSRAELFRQLRDRR